MPKFPLAAMSFVICLLAGLTSQAATNSNTNADKEAGWSDEVNGLQARIRLERVRVSNGTPIIATYLKLRNRSDVASPMRIPWSRKLMTFRVVDANGTELKNLNVSYDGMDSGGSGDLVLPIRGELSFDYSSHGAGIPGDKAASIDLGVDANWVIERNQGDCFLHATLEVPGFGPVPGGERWHGRIELLPVRIPVQSESMDAATIKARISELGPKMLKDNGRESEDAERELSLIDDAGVISWYVKAIELKSYHLKFCAVDRLSRFDNDEAFAALKKGIATTADDFERANESVKPALAHNIRVAAAQGLARSPHRDAKRFLMTFWNDRDASVRLDVLHAAARMHTSESAELLRKMSADQSEMVRNEALRYLKERGPNADKK